MSSVAKLWATCAAALAILAAAVTSLALLARHFADRPGAGLAGVALLDPNNRELWETAGLGACLVLALAFPRLGRRAFAKLAASFRHIAANRKLAIGFSALFPVVLRLSLLPAIPVPQPHIGDEFGYLLLAETFASGRITNPTHPMWRFFESLYVFHQPTYSSQYPMAQGLILAIPLALGVHLWIGVLLSAALMCGALCWMLQGWLPPRWALLGALIAGVRYAIPTSWMNTYWGGATTAIGGALLMGALPRLLRQARPREILLAGVGVFILSQSRPFEGFLLCIPVAVLLLTRLIPAHLRIAAALATVSIAALGVGLYYNARVTGHALLWPYQLHQRLYGTPQNLLWNPPVLAATRASEFKDIRDNFQWQLGLFQDQSTWDGFRDALQAKARSFWDFFLSPVMTLPLLALPLLWRREPARFLFTACLFVLLADFLLYPFFYPHYAAMLCGPLLVLVLQGARYLRTLGRPRKLFGDALFRWSLLTGALSSFAFLAGAALAPIYISQAATPRGLVESELQRRGGQHLVLVRYSPTHSIHEPWIYNAADIDRSPIVWAREMDEASLAPLLRYYSGRQVWLVNADAQPPKLKPYADRFNPDITAIHNAAGKSPFIDQGIAPGSLITVFGTNLGPNDSMSCVIPGVQHGRKPLAPAPALPLDGARPGVLVPMHWGVLPRLAIGPSALYWGATFALTGESPKLPAANPGRLSVRFGDLPGNVLCVQPSGDAQAATILVPPQLSGDSVDIALDVTAPKTGVHETIEKAVPLLPANPGILQIYSSGRRALVLHLDDSRLDESLVTPRNPAHRGEVVRVFVTGIGPLDGASPKFPIVAGVNDRGANLEFINCAECAAGIAELGVKVPEQSALGDQISLSVAVAAAAGKTIYSNPSVISVR